MENNLKWLTNVFAIMVVLCVVTGVAGYVLSGPVWLSNALETLLWIAGYNAALGLLALCGWLDMRRLRNRAEREANLHAAYRFIMNQEK